MKPTRQTPRHFECAMALAVAALAGGCGGPVEPDELDPRHVLSVVYDALRGPAWANGDNWKTSAPLHEWYGVTTDEWGDVTELDLGENNLAGSIPPEIGSLGALVSLRLGANRLTGSIPPEIGNLRGLGVLRLGGNNLTGSIPPEIGDLENLHHLHLGGNDLTGTIPV